MIPSYDQFVPQYIDIDGSNSECWDLTSHGSIEIARIAMGSIRKGMSVVIGPIAIQSDVSRVVYREYHVGTQMTADQDSYEGPMTVFICCKANMRAKDAWEVSEAHLFMRATYLLGQFRQCT